MASNSNGHKTNGHKAAAHQISAKIRKIYTADKKKLKAAGKSITKAAKNAKVKFTEVEETVEDYTKKNPWKTIGMSLLAGVLVGKIMHK